MMYILLTGYPSFIGEDEESIFEKILNQQLNLDVPQLKNVYESCKDLIAKLLDINANRIIKSEDELNIFILELMLAIF